jgi:alginate O-acetyltransferase complex protein AlgI
MLISSLRFLLFVGLSLGVYHSLPRRLQHFWLLLISYVFVAFWDWSFALVLALSTMVNYALALLLDQNAARRRTWLWVGIGLNAFLLLFFRAADFFLPAFAVLAGNFGFQIPSEGLQILIPLGLSYYVLGNVSYLVDVYRGQMKPEADFWSFALYSAYFPKLTAGPIERAQSFLPKLAQPRLVDIHVLAQSTVLIFIGFLRKLFIADILTASIIKDVYSLPAKYTSTELVIWLIIYSFAIYNDFAGYTNIVRGISGLFGIELNPNFKTPYFSRSFTEFWTRWHISLSEWLRDYIYFPLSRALLRRDARRQSVTNLVLPPLATMMMSGLWHGFGLHMLLWGGLHGTYLIAERVLSHIRPGRIPQGQKWPRQILSMLVVFTFVTLAWIPFRWELPAAFEFWRALFNWSSFDIRYRRIFLLLPMIFLSLALDFLQHFRNDEFIFLKWPRRVRAVLMALIVVLVVILTSDDFKQPFVYQAF